MLSQPLIRSVDQNSLQPFYKRFSGHERTQMSDRQGADARRDATSGHFVCFSRPGAGALDEVNRVRILEGQLEARCDDESCRVSCFFQPSFTGSGECCSGGASNSRRHRMFPRCPRRVRCGRRQRLSGQLRTSPPGAWQRRRRSRLIGQGQPLARLTLRDSSDGKAFSKGTFMF